MSDDNLGNFFDPDHFEDEENDGSENWKPIKVQGKALFAKAIDILNLSQTICDLLPENDDHAETTQRLILENASIITAKIKGAMAVDDTYSLVMENAVIIKVNICELKAQLWACEALHGIEEKYIAVMRHEIDAFKKIFVQWVNCFDKENDLPDEWHLFNNPASFSDDEDLFNGFNPDET
jgi:hypothetical protein